MRLRLTLLIAALTLVMTACGADTADGPESASTETAISGLPGGPALDASTLTVDLPCGFGFAKGSADGSLLLSISFTGDWIEDGPPLDEPIALGPDSEWTGRIETGVALLAGWCQDSTGEGDPVPKANQQFEIVSGTLVASSDGRTAAAILTDVVARPVSDGDIVEWGEVELRNDAWGVFAG